MFERDQGVCAHCGADTKLQEKEILKVTKAFASKTFKVPPNKVRFVRLFSLWEADHIKPKHKGGLDTLDNLQTLCLKCHQEKTYIDLNSWWSVS